MPESTFQSTAQSLASVELFQLLNSFSRSLIGIFPFSSTPDAGALIGLECFLATATVYKGNWQFKCWREPKQSEVLEEKKKEITIAKDKEL